MKILVRFAGRPYDAVNKPYIWVSLDNGEITLKNLLIKLEVETGVKFNLEDAGIIVLVNGVRMEYAGGLHTKLKDMDEVLIASVAGGG